MSAFVAEAADFLVDAGYNRRDIVRECTYTTKANDGSLKDNRIDLVAFAPGPHDMRNACIAAFDAREDRAASLESLRFLTTPLAMVGDSEKVEFWSVRKSPATAPFDTVARKGWQLRQRSRLADFSPKTIAEAKEDRIQLDFVDAGLEPWTRSVTSTSLKSLLEELIATSLARFQDNEKARNDVLRLIFHLFACRALEDKGVIARANSPREALQLANQHFSENISAQVLDSANITDRLVADVFTKLREQFSFATLTTDILAHSYENALVTESGRHELGIYYTPPSLTEYILRRLPIEAIPQEKRTLWDPCCGCGSFLLAGFDRLAAMVPDMTPGERHKYLRKRLVGSDKDPFACELASLSLVLTDLHNHNGWKVKTLDATTVTLAELDAKPNIIATNLPFKELKDGDRRELSAEILIHLIDMVEPGALLGVVLPQSFLGLTAAAPARQKILATCEIMEIAILPGAFFESATETVVLLLRKQRAARQSGVVTVRELRPADFQTFLRNGSFTRTYPVDVSRWLADGESVFRVSPLLGLWDRLERECLPLDQVAEVKTGIRVSTTGDTSAVSDRETKAHDKPFVDRTGVLRPFALLTENDLMPTKWLHYGKHLDRAREEAIFLPPKVLINSNRNPGSAWRIVGAISRKPLYYSENFNAVIPTTQFPVELLAAVLNSPVANAWFDTNCKTRKVNTDTLEKLPVPRFDERLSQRIVKCVLLLEKSVTEKWKKEEEGMFYDGMEETPDATNLLAEIDSLVFDAYGLSPHERKNIATLMSTDKRPS